MFSHSLMIYIHIYIYIYINIYIYIYIYIYAVVIVCTRRRHATLERPFVLLLRGLRLLQASAGYAGVDSNHNGFFNDP